MKKLFVFAASAMLGFASCADNEVVYDDATPQEIGLFPVANTMTRTAIADETFSHGNMAVAAYLAAGSTTAGNYFGKTIFSGSEDAYVGAQYWPIQTTTLNFLAVAPETEDQVTSEFDTTTPASEVVVTVTNNHQNQNDVMYAAAQGTKTVNATPGPVGMVFKHALAWVNFAFKKGDNTDNYTITINSIKLQGATYDGELTVTLDEYASITSIDSDDAVINWDFNNIDPVDDVTVPYGNIDNSTETLELNEDDFGTYGDGLLVAPVTTSATSFVINYTVAAETG